MPQRPVNPPPAPMGAKEEQHALTVRIGMGLYERCKKAALKNQVFMWQIVEWGMREYLAQHGGEPEPESKSPARPRRARQKH